MYFLSNYIRFKKELKKYDAAKARFDKNLFRLILWRPTIAETFSSIIVSRKNFMSGIG